MASRPCLFIIVFLFAFLFATRGHDSSPIRLVIWNVGQGQWATWITDAGCFHADMGGEFAPWREIQDQCRQKPNVISLSHWDTDHISFIGRISHSLPNSCLLYAPQGESTLRKQRMIRKIKKCEDLGSPFTTWAPGRGFKHLSSNDTSRVLLWKGVLAPGDSSARTENLWANQLDGIENTRILLLGHHGSRTSTGPLLISKLRKLGMAIASARYKRYRHPHIETLNRLREHCTPVLTTEDWGNIHIEL